MGSIKIDLTWEENVFILIHNKVLTHELLEHSLSLEGNLNMLFWYNFWHEILAWLNDIQCNLYIKYELYTLKKAYLV